MNLDELQRLAEGATPGPWKVVQDEYPHKLGGTHIERRIGTSWEHPQLKGPVGVVNISYGLGEKDGDPAKVFFHIDPEDAAYIAAMSPDTAKKLIAVARAAQAVLKETPDQWGAIPRLRTALEELK